MHLQVTICSAFASDHMFCIQAIEHGSLAWAALLAARSYCRPACLHAVAAWASTL